MDITEVQEMKNMTILFLADLYEDLMNTCEFDYETVEAFYDYLLNQVLAGRLLEILEIDSVKKLQEKMLSIDRYI